MSWFKNFVGSWRRNPTVTDRVSVFSKLWPRKRARNLYRVMWRWHFYMGLFVTPILIIVSLAGSIYVFRDEIEPLMVPELLFVKAVGDETMPVSQAIANAEAAYPDYHVYALNTYREPDKAWTLQTENEAEEYQTVYVDQYSGEVLGARNQAEGFFGIVLKIHRQLFAGTFGRVVVETSTAWGIISIITGLFLWWPRTKEKIRGVFTLRLNKSRKIFWRDLHSVPAVYISIFAVLIMFTGMLFTVTGQYTILGTGLALGQIPEVYLSSPKSEVIEGAAPIGIDRAIEIYLSTGEAEHFNLVVPHDAEDAPYTFNVNLDRDFQNGRLLYLDRYSGETIADVRWDDLTWFAKMLLYFYPIHVGNIYGLPTKILAFIACWIIILMSVSGVVMWWQRKPATALIGPPPKPKTAVIPRVVTVLTILFGLLLPTVGISLILILLGSWLVAIYEKRRVSVQGRLSVELDVER